MESIWSKSAVIRDRKSLTGDSVSDAVVIGGGLAGILTAYYLRQNGIQTIVLEGDTIGSGQTKNTTAKITSQHDLIYDQLIQKIGEEQARQYADANQQAILEYKRIIQEKNIDCEFEERDAYLYSNEDDALLRKETDAAVKLGIDAEFVTETTLPFQVKGACKFKGQAQFHPLLFLSQIAEGLEIYEHTKVKSVEEDCVITECGVVKAKHIIFTTHFPFINMPGHYYIKMHQERSYVLAIEGAKQLDGMYKGIDQDALSLRNSGTMLLIGGGGHRTGENSAGGKYNMLKDAAAKYWPEYKEVTHWSAQDCITLDNVPYIGQYSSSRPNWYVAAGFKKWGMTSSMAAAKIINDLILGRDNRNAAVFSPKRVHFSTPAKSMMKEGLQAVKGLTRELFKIPKSEIDALPVGHGGVVEYDGRKVGVYKNKDEETFIVSIRCPHLGCQLEWNPDELSWDCPCHGSRFNYKGLLIDNPAQEDIKYE